MRIKAVLESLPADVPAWRLLVSSRRAGKRFTSRLSRGLHMLRRSVSQLGYCDHVRLIPETDKPSRYRRSTSAIQAGQKRDRSGTNRLHDTYLIILSIRYDETIKIAAKRPNAPPTAIFLLPGGNHALPGLPSWRAGSDPQAPNKRDRSGTEAGQKRDKSIL
jgi:hypothetical protein